LVDLQKPSKQGKLQAIAIGENKQNNINNPKNQPNLPLDCHKCNKPKKKKVTEQQK
jgi:hypothetical protein